MIKLYYAILQEVYAWNVSIIQLEGIAITAKRGITATRENPLPTIRLASPVIVILLELLEKFAIKPADSVPAKMA